MGQAAAPALTPLLGLPDVGRISDRYPTWVVPSGYAFSIWSLIFALSIAYAVWQLMPAQRENPLLRRVGWMTAGVTCGVYLGWITVATVANVAQALTATGVTELGLGGETWGMVMLIAAALIASAVTLATRNAAYPLAVVWALVAVFVARRSPPALTQSDAVAYVALGAAAVVGVALLVMLMRARRV